MEPTKGKSNPVAVFFNKIGVWLKQNISKKIAIRGLIGALLTAVVIKLATHFLSDEILNFYEKTIPYKYVAVIMSNSDPNFTIPTEFLRGFGDKGQFEDSKIRIERKDDLYSPEQAKIVAEKLVEDENCLMIIGNSNSALSEITLTAILNSKSDRPAFILPIATADNIIDKAKGEGYDMILRMVPDNRNQAKTITRLVFRNNNNVNVGILIDEENNAYSQNLSKNIAASIMERKGSIAFQKSYGNSSRLIDFYKNMTTDSILPNYIIFVGVSTNGLLLIEELRSLRIKIPVIFTDGCTVKKLMDAAKENEKSFQSYFLSSVSTSRSTTDQGEPTYVPIGTDAYSLAKRIITNVGNDVDRQSLSNYFKKSKKDINLSNGSAGEYQFGENGNNQLMNFKVYSYKEGLLKEEIGID